jgi:hypothetical protein
MSAEDFAAVRHYADRKDHVSAEANKAIIAALARLEARLAEQHELILRGQTREAEILRLEANCEALTAALRECRGLFSELRGDWSDNRGPCREGFRIIDAALATSEQATEEGA